MNTGTYARCFDETLNDLFQNFIIKHRLTNLYNIYKLCKYSWSWCYEYPLKPCTVFEPPKAVETVDSFRTSNTGWSPVQFSNLDLECLWYHWVNVSVYSNKELKPLYICIWIKMYIPTLNCADPSVPLVLRPKFNVQIRN